MDEIFEFHIPQTPSRCPVLSGRDARIAQVRQIDYSGGLPNHLILYQVQYRADGAWHTLTSPIPGDGVWFGFTVAPQDPTVDLQGQCLRHLLSSVLTVGDTVSVREYLAVYRSEAARPTTVHGSGGQVYEAWDLMAVQTYGVDGAAVAQSQYGTVKIRSPWYKGQARPDPPMDRGLYCQYPLAVFSAAGARESFQRRLASMALRHQGTPLDGLTLEIYHNPQPGGVV